MSTRKQWPVDVLRVGRVHNGVGTAITAADTRNSRVQDFLEGVVGLAGVHQDRSSGVPIVADPLNTGLEEKYCANRYRTRPSSSSGP